MKLKIIKYKQAPHWRLIDQDNNDQTLRYEDHGLVASHIWGNRDQGMVARNTKKDLIDDCLAILIVLIHPRIPSLKFLRIDKTLSGKQYLLKDRDNYVVIPHPTGRALPIEIRAKTRAAVVDQVLRVIAAYIEARN